MKVNQYVLNRLYYSLQNEGGWKTKPKNPCPPCLAWNLRTELRLSLPRWERDGFCCMSYPSNGFFFVYLGSGGSSRVFRILLATFSLSLAWGYLEQTEGKLFLCLTISCPILVTLSFTLIMSTKFRLELFIFRLSSPVLCVNNCIVIFVGFCALRNLHQTCSLKFNTGLKCNFAKLNWAVI